MPKNQRSQSLWLRANHVQHRDDGFECDGSLSGTANGGTVAKFVKCLTINFSQIDQMHAVDLTLATPLAFARLTALQ
jgi:hypothetical protein